MAFAHFSRQAAASASGRLGVHAIRQLHALLRGACLFGGVFLAFGPAYSWLLLRLLYGASWSDGETPQLLAFYCGYVCLMAVNGVAEAFVNATASRAQLNSLASAMVGMSVLYVPAAALGFHSAGAVGLVLANCASMLARIAYAFSFVRHATADSLADAPADEAPGSTPRLLPHASALLALAVSAFVTSAAKLWLGLPASPPALHACHVGVGALCLIFVLLTVLKAEPELLEALKAARKKD